MVVRHDLRYSCPRMKTPVYNREYARGWWKRPGRGLPKKLLYAPPDPNARIKPRLARAVWAYELGDSPVCQPGDIGRARAYLRRIQQVIEQGGWTHGERTRLYRLEKKWHKRAYRQDIRFMILGTRPGRTSYDDRDRMDQYVVDHRNTYED